MLWKIKSSEVGAHIHIHTQHKNKKQTRRCVSFTSVQNDGGWAVAAHYNKPTYIRNKNRLQCGQQALLLKKTPDIVSINYCYTPHLQRGCFEWETWPGFVMTRGYVRMRKWALSIDREGCDDFNQREH